MKRSEGQEVPNSTSKKGDLPSSTTMEGDQNVGQGAEPLIFHEDIVV